MITNCKGQLRCKTKETVNKSGITQNAIMRRILILDSKGLDPHSMRTECDFWLTGLHLGSCKKH